MGFFTNDLVTNITIGSNVKFYNNSMYNAFSNCKNLNKVITIPAGTSNLARTFYGCSNLNVSITIPGTVENMSETFRSCSKLNRSVSIPSSVRTMYYTFGSCSNLNVTISLPSGPTNLYGIFSGCSRLNKAINIPATTTDFRYAFYQCSNFNTTIRIPETAPFDSMYYSFGYCSNLKYITINVPKNVTNMAYAAYGAKSPSFFFYSPMVNNAWYLASRSSNTNGFITLNVNKVRGTNTYTYLYNSGNGGHLRGNSGTWSSDTWKPTYSSGTTIQYETQVGFKLIW